MKKILFAALALAVLAPCAAVAGDNSEALKRDDVAVIKKKLNTVLDAMGLPPAGFAKQKDDFNLPTEVSTDKGKLLSAQASVSREFAIKGVKDAEAAAKQTGMDYQKKLLEAQAKGDYQEMSRLAQEMNQKTGEAGLAGMQAQEDKKLPIDVRVFLNRWESKSIDPDLVVVEKPGVLGLKTEQGDEGDPRETVTLYFQPVTLKDTKDLSQFEIKTGAVKSKTGVCTIVIELEGPAADVEAWAKRVSTDKVLALVDTTVK